MQPQRQVGGSARCVLVGFALPSSSRSFDERRSDHGDTGSSYRQQRPRRCGSRHRDVRHDRHRRRPGRPCGRLLPEEARAAVRDPRCERADRRLVADAHLGLAPPLHSGPLRRAAGLVVSRAPGGRFPTARRGGRLPRGLCGAVRSTRAYRHGRDSPREGRRPVRRGVRRAPVRGRPRRRGDRLLRKTVSARVCIGARPPHRADALERLPGSFPAAARRRSPRRRRELRRGHRDGSVEDSPDLALRKRQGSDPIPDRAPASARWSCRCSGSSPRTS